MNVRVLYSHTQRPVVFGQRYARKKLESWFSSIGDQTKVFSIFLVSWPVGSVIRSADFSDED